MATFTWIDIENGESALSVRNKLNAALEATASHTHASTEVSYSNVVSGMSASNVKDAVDELDNRIDTLEGPSDTEQFNPLATPPTPNSEGQVFYDNAYHTLAVQTDISGHPTRVGVENKIRVANNTGVTITAGEAVRNAGTVTTSPAAIDITLAQADSLTDAFVLGLVAEDIPDGSQGWVITEGFLTGVNTSAFTPGKVLFLSDTVAGGLENRTFGSYPDITSTVGAATQIDPVAGVIYVTRNNLITYPEASAFMKGLDSPTYSLTTTAQTISGYTTANTVDIIASADEVSGSITVPLPGLYNISFTAIMSFSSVSSTRTVYFELYNETTSTVEGAFPCNIPRDATEDGTSFTAPFRATSGDEYSIRVRASTAMSLTFDNVAFMISSNKLG